MGLDVQCQALAEEAGIEGVSIDLLLLNLLLHS